MPIMRGLEGTFDTVASEYAKMRPGYVDELYEKIFEYIPIDGRSNAIEVGIGGGQATEPILKTGCKVTAIEYGENFSRLCQEKFSRYPNFSVITSKFEDAELKEDFYDVVYSASAFHWVLEEQGYLKVLSILKSGGAFARFANRPCRDKGDPLLAEEIDKLYEQYYENFYTGEQRRPSEYTEEMARATADIAGKYGFTDIRYYMFYRTRTLTAKEYTAFLGTHSDHIAMDDGIRREFFSKIEEVINHHGGKCTLYDTIDLELARKQ